MPGASNQRGKTGRKQGPGLGRQSESCSFSPRFVTPAHAPDPTEDSAEGQHPGFHQEFLLWKMREMRGGEQSPRAKDSSVQGEDCQTLGSVLGRSVFRGDAVPTPAGGRREAFLPHPGQVTAALGLGVSPCLLHSLPAGC